jgi:hypothetical protein
MVVVPSRSRRKRGVTARGVILAAVAIAAPGFAQTPQPPCDPAGFIQRVAALSADSMEGRWPGTPGGRRAATYIAREFALAGLTRFGGSYFQQVPMLNRQSAGGQLALIDGPANTTIAADASVTLESDVTAPHVTGSAEPIFVGYGIHAPQLRWDDFANVDVKGRVLIVLSGAPDSTHLIFPWGSDDVRSGDAYKLAVARARGARGVVFLSANHRARPVRLTADHVSGTPLGFVAWLGADATSTLARAFALTTDALVERATQRARTSRLPGRISFVVDQEAAKVAAPNIIGIIPGKSRNATVALFVAHYDHLGTRRSSTGADSIFHGALDNASGVSALLCLARSFAETHRAFNRTLVFLATTGEEQQGHLGASWFVDHPVVPLSQIAIALNIDGVNTIIPTNDFLALPASLSDASETFQTMGSSTGMTLSAVSFERGLDWSFDTEVFNRHGVPAFTIWQGVSGRGVSDQEFFRLSRATNSGYHTPSDTVSTDWNVDAISQHLALLREIGERFANGARRPLLKRESPFSLWNMLK